jgi:hypothetical protein
MREYTLIGPGGARYKLSDVPTNILRAHLMPGVGPILTLDGTAAPDEDFDEQVRIQFRGRDR